MDILSYILSRKYVDKAIKKLKKETAEQSIDKEVIEDIIKESGVVDNSDKVSYEHLGKLGAKNLLVYPYSVMDKIVVSNGLNFILDDTDNLGQIVVDGTCSGSGYRYASRDIFQYVKKVKWLGAGTYILSNGVDFTQLNAQYIYIILRLYDRLNNVYYINASTSMHNTEVEFSITDEQVNALKSGELELNIRIYVGIPNSVKTDITFDNIVVKPMIRLASDTDDTWQPYAMPNYKLTQNVNSLSYIKDIQIAKGEANGAIIVNNPNNHAQGIESFAEGHNTQARGSYSHAEGYGTIANGSNAHAEGGNTTAGSNAHAEGNATTANGNNSHAEGYTTNANGINSHAECANTTANGKMAHAEGQYSIAGGDVSHAEGTSNALGSYSHSQNRGTNAQGYCQTAIGKYNVAQGTQDSVADTDYALIIGNGSADDKRSNALAVQWNGNVVFQDGSKMKSSKDAYKVMGKMGAKNLLAYPYQSNTVISNGVTYVPNDDGSITADGTPTDYAYILLYGEKNRLKLAIGEYILSCDAEFTSKYQYLAIWYKATPNTAGVVLAKCNLANKSCKFAITQEIFDTIQSEVGYLLVRLVTENDGTYDNLTVYPMLRLADDQDDTWTPYVPTNAELAQQIKNLSVGNVDYDVIKQMINDALTEMIQNNQPTTEDQPKTEDPSNDNNPDPIVVPELDDTIVTRELPEGYTQIPYVKTDGNQFVSTYVKEDKCARAEYEVAWTEEPNTYGNIILSSKNLRYPYPVAHGQDKIIQLKIFDRYKNANLDWNLDQRYRFDASVNGDTTINGVKYLTNSLLDGEVFDSKSSISLFNDGGEPSNKTHYFIGKLYYCKLYDNNNNIIKDYVPCINSEGVAGLYEFVTKKFVTSATKSPFLAE